MSARVDHLERAFCPLARPDDETQVIFLEADPLAGQLRRSSSGQLKHGRFLPRDHATEYHRAPRRALQAQRCCSSACPISVIERRGWKSDRSFTVSAIVEQFFELSFIEPSLLILAPELSFARSHDTIHQAVFSDRRTRAASHSAPPWGCAELDAVSMASSLSAGPRGKVPRSQFETVLWSTPRRLAKSSCVSPNERRSALMSICLSIPKLWKVHSGMSMSFPYQNMAKRYLWNYTND